MKAEPEMDLYFWITGCVCWAFLFLYYIYVHLTGTHPIQTLLSALPACALHRFTGFYCPGCGGTRAVYALLHGHILKSIFYHPIVLYTFITTTIFMISQTMDHLMYLLPIRKKNRHLSIPVMHVRGIYLYVAAILILFNFIIKNACILFYGNHLLG